MQSLIARIVDGKLVTNDEMLRRFAAKHEGKVCDVVPRSKKRSTSQNSLYWLYLEVIANETGNESAEDLHEFFKSRLLPRRHATIKGKRGAVEIEIPKSTKELTVGEFVDYMLKIEVMTGIPVPDPEDAGFISNHRPYHSPRGISAR